MANCWAGLLDCKVCKSGIYEKGSDVSLTAEKGDKVRVTFEAEYTGKPSGLTSSKPDKHMLKINGKETWVPDTATVTVVEKAIPAEPARGSIVRFNDGTVYGKYSPDYWILISGSGRSWGQTWAEIVKAHGVTFSVFVIEPMGVALRRTNGTSGYFYASTGA